MTSGRIVQQRLRTPTGPFFARFFIGIILVQRDNQDGNLSRYILGLVAEFAFMRPSTRLTKSSSAARWKSRKQTVGWKFRRGCSTGRQAMTPGF
jgi:hypothetical protein